MGWRYVIFDRRRSFGAALNGDRLGSADLDTCPELPYAAALAARLEASRHATLSGRSGTGKSITAFHAARRLNDAGWAVVVLSRNGIAGHAEVHALRTMPGPALAVVDDAQALDPRVVADATAVVDDDHASPSSPPSGSTRTTSRRSPKHARRISSTCTASPTSTRSAPARPARRSGRLRSHARGTAAKIAGRERQLARPVVVHVRRLRW